MRATPSAPFLCRIKSWQLVGLGITGWVTLYSITLIHWAACTTFVGNIQGGCFAATMTLASLETRRLYKNKSRRDQDALHHSLHWADNISTFELNQTLGRVQQKKGFTTEALHQLEKEMGFGLRAVKDGRTILFETGRWKEPTIDLVHAQTTDENRKMAMADRAVIISIGVPDEETKYFIKSASVQLLAGEELLNLIESEIPKPEKETMPGQENSV